MKPCISQATTMGCSFAEDVEAYADAGCEGIEVWLTKLEKHLEEHSPESTCKLLEDRNISPAAASYQGGLLLSQGEERRAHYDHFQRRLSMCQAMGIPTLILAPDFETNIDQTGLQRAQVSLVQAAQLAASFEVNLALEFRGRGTWCTSLDTALAMIRSFAEPNLGLCIDAFHFYIGPSKLEDFLKLRADDVAFIQLCDLAGTPRELASDSDRILPGDGDFQLQPIVDHLKTISYPGWISVELFNPDIWKIKPVQVAEASITALRRLLGQAQMPR